MIELGDGLTLEDATQADLDEIHANLRAGDAAEHAYDDEDKIPIDHLPGVKVIRHNGVLLGYIGAQPIAGENQLSNRRHIYYLSTKEADKMKLTYVKRTRDVLRAYLDNFAPDYVDEIYTVAMPIEYPPACKWIERILRFKPVKDVEWRGGVHRIYVIQRKDI